MNKVVVITTGGTIASKENPNTGGFTSGAISGDNLIKQIPETNSIIEIKELFKKPSSYLTIDDMLTMSKKIYQEASKKDVNGVVVLHGTDTMEESSYLTDLLYNLKKPIVFTGSQKGPFEIGSDSISNITDSIKVASSNKSRNKGVMVVFNQKIHSAQYVIKSDAHNIDGFSSPFSGPIGMVDGKDINFMTTPSPSEFFTVNTINANVDLVKLVVDMKEHFIKAAIEKEVDGIVIEGFGRGHVTPDMMEEITKAINANISVVISSRSYNGMVKNKYDFIGGGIDLKKKGAIHSNSSIGQKIRIKLILAISSGYSKKEIAKVI